MLGKNGMLGFMTQSFLFNEGNCMRQMTCYVLMSSYERGNWLLLKLDIHNFLIIGSIQDQDDF